MPHWTTVYDWIKANEELSLRFARAREMGFDAIAEDILEMVDQAPERHDTQFGDKVDPGYVQWIRARVEARLKLLAKWSSKKYGDKVELDHGVTDEVAEILRAVSAQNRSKPLVPK